MCAAFNRLHIDTYEAGDYGATFPLIRLNEEGKGVIYSPQVSPHALFYSSDFARSWQLAECYGIYGVTDLTIHRSGFGLVACHEGIAVSDDSGKSWLLAIPGVKALSVSISGNETGYVGCEDGIIYVTEDRGVNWHQTVLELNGEPTTAHSGLGANSGSVPITGMDVIDAFTKDASVAHES